MNNRNKTLALNMIFFGLVTFVSKGVAYLLLPIFTSYMTTADYGIADLLVSTVNMLYPLTALGMSAAILRYTITEEDDRKYIFTAALRITLTTSFVTILAIPIIIRVTGISSYIWFIPLSMLFTNLIAIMVSLCKGIGKNNLFLLQSVVRGGVLLASAIVTLKFLDMGIIGYIISYLVADVASVVCFAISIHVHQYIVINPDRNTLKTYGRKLMKYGVPLVPNSMSAWVVQMSDRYMVAFWHGTSLNGLYGVAYKIPSIIKVLTSIFISAWQLNVISESDKKDSGEYFDNIKGLYSAVCFIIAALIMVFVKLLARILFAKEFYEAWKYVPLLVLAMVVDLLAEYLGTYFYAKDRTGYLFLSTMLGAVVNVILNVILIPPFGAWGATVATVISCTALYVHRGWNIKRITGFKSLSVRDMVGVVILTGLCMIYYFLEPCGLLLSIGALAVILMLFHKEVVLILELVKNILKKVKDGRGMDET